MTNLLSNVTVLDLTQRLPGPLAAKQLMDMGAIVLKVSPLNKKDAFEKIENALFNHWYKSFNLGKKIMEIDFDKLQGFIDQSDIIIAPFKLDLSKFKLIEKSVVYVHGSENNKPMHDLNAFAKSSSFHLFMQSEAHKKMEKRISPPFLPIAGIIYANTIALNALSSYIKTIETKSTTITNLYLDKSAANILDLFYTKKLKETDEFLFLHNGLYPCYNLYRTSDDHFIALASIEEHYWKKFCELFKLSLKIEDRFDTSDVTFNILIKTFSESTLSSIIQRVGSHDICLTPVE